MCWKQSMCSAALSVMFACSGGIDGDQRGQDDASGANDGAVLDGRSNPDASTRPSDGGSLKDTDATVPPMPVSGPKLFVATTGDDAQDGRTEGTALQTIGEAAKRAVAGDTIYVKAGDYGREEVVFEGNGEPMKPIVLEGYSKTPGDRPKRDDFDHTSVADTTRLPLLDGQDRTGTALTLHGKQNLQIRGLQIFRYEQAIPAWNASDVIVEHVYAADLGENDDTVYSGGGIRFGSGAKNCIVRDSVVVNAGAEGIVMSGEDNLVDNVRVYSVVENHTNENSTDYYVLTTGARNVIQNSRIERVGDQPHLGHGFGIKANGTGILFRNNVAIGIAGGAFYVRHRGVVDNQFIGNTAQGKGFGILIRDGASRNIFEKHTTEDAVAGVVFMDTSEDAGQTFSGNDNIIRDSSFRDSTVAAVYFIDYIYNDSYARGNVLESVTIDGAPALFEVRSYGENNILRNSVVRNVDVFSSARPPRTQDDHGFALSAVSGSNNGFALP